MNQETWRRIGSSAGHAVQLEHTPKTLYERMSDDLRSERTASAWVGVFGVIALLLAALGAYGVLAQSVLQRTRELAVRSVLGATPTDLFAMVTAEAARLAVAGGVLGAASGVIAFRVVHAMFSTVSVLDNRSGGRGGRAPRRRHVGRDVDPRQACRAVGSCGVAAFGLKSRGERRCGLYSPAAPPKKIPDMRTFESRTT